MKNVVLWTLVLSCLYLIPNANGQQIKLDAPANWRSESVALPPPFARQVKLKGKAKVRFSPGWADRKSDQFFTYAFKFQTEADPKFDKKLIEKELLAYFGGLATAVSRGKVDPAEFKLTVKEVKQDSAEIKRFTGKLKWTEPFFTKSEHTLNLEIDTHFNATEKKNYLMVCASPQDPKSEADASKKVWKQLRKVRDDSNRPKNSKSKSE